MHRIHSVYGSIILFLGLGMHLFDVVCSTVVHWVCCIGKSMKCSNHRKGRKGVDGKIGGMDSWPGCSSCVTAATCNCWANGLEKRISHLVNTICYATLSADFQVLDCSVFELVRKLQAYLPPAETRWAPARYLKPDLLCLDAFGMKSYPPKRAASLPDGYPGGSGGRAHAGSKLPTKVRGDDGRCAQRDGQAGDRDGDGGWRPWAFHRRSPRWGSVARRGTLSNDRCTSSRDGSTPIGGPASPTKSTDW